METFDAGQTFLCNASHITNARATRHESMPHWHTLCLVAPTFVSAASKWFDEQTADRLRDEPSLQPPARSMLCGYSLLPTQTLPSRMWMQSKLMSWYMITINIGWEYFLGIIGMLIALAYYANGRLTRLETNFDWLAVGLRDLSIKIENVSTKAFEVDSPISLTATGERLLRDSGLKSYIDRRLDELSAQVRLSAPLDPYAIQESTFRLLDRLPLDDSFARTLNKFAFRTGTSTALLRRVGAIYLRDITVTPH